jgi:hypothetical protein
MNPYLENPVWWLGIHNALMTFLWTTINAALPARYIANMAERVYVVEPDREIYPDVWIEEQRTEPGSARARRPVSAAIAADPALLLDVESDEIHEAFIQIVPVEDESRVLTAIEILSPSNKTSGHPGRKLYRKKQREILSSDASLLEIDLLRTGEHTVVAPLARLSQRTTWRYLVSLSRGWQRSPVEAWAIKLQERLPRVTVPIVETEPDLVVDLQIILNRIYEEGPFARRIDYQRDPPVPLSPADAAWADALLREKGLRT